MFILRYNMSMVFIITHKVNIVVINYLSTIIFTIGHIFHIMYRIQYNQSTRFAR
jgi:hypothetical protein